MPINMPDETLITIQKRLLPADFQMPQMERAESHYSLGFILSGDRRIITPFEQFDVHKGDVTALPPQLYHRTFSLSDEPYANYLIKISASLADDFRREINADIWSAVYEQKHFTFEEETIRIIELLLEDMRKIYEEKRSYSDVLLKGGLYRLILLIHEKNTAENTQTFKSALSHDIMEAMYYVEQHYAEEIRLSDAASAVGFSDGHFSRMFTSQVGISFSQYLINVRLRRAKELLVNTDLSISDIALRTGFNSGDYLSACFHKYEHSTPTAFRRMKSPAKGFTV